MTAVAVTCPVHGTIIGRRKNGRLAARCLLCLREAKRALRYNGRKARLLAAIDPDSPDGEAQAEATLRMLATAKTARPAPGAADRKPQSTLSPAAASGGSRVSPNQTASAGTSLDGTCADARRQEGTLHALADSD